MPILTPQERIGTVVADKFELCSVLGRGGMGVVYEALHRWTGRRVAIKLIDPALADDPELATRFLHEARAAARLRHPNVVDVLDMGRSEDDGTVYQVLALLEGETLGARLKQVGSLSWVDTVALLAPVMDALEMAHAQGIVHRDVKPDNVFLRRRPGGEDPVLLDFGMAKLMDARPVTQNSSAVFGTPHYMAPEQALGAGKVGPSADVWSMGVMMFECLSGDLPFGRGPAAAYLARVVYEQAPSLAERRPDLPPALTRLIDRTLIRDADERIGSMGELLANVRDVAAREGVTLPDPRSGLSLAVPARPVNRSRRWLAIAGAVALLALGLGGLHTLRGSVDKATASSTPPAGPTKSQTVAPTAPMAALPVPPRVEAPAPAPANADGADAPPQKTSNRGQGPRRVDRRRDSRAATANPKPLEPGMTEVW